MKTKKLFFVTIMLILALCISCTRRAKYGEPVTIYITDDKGNENPVIAVSGQVIVFFMNNQFMDEQKQIIKSCDGKIIEHIPEICYYLIKTGKGKETEFIEKIKATNGVEDAYVNQVSSVNSTVIDVIDDFTNTNWTGYIHGEYVNESAKSACPNCIISNVRDVKGVFSDANIIKEINRIFSENKDQTTPILINISFGEYIYRMKKIDENKFDFITKKNQKGKDDYVKVKWEERAGYTEALWKEERENWAYRYKGSLKRLAEWLAKYSDREFIVTKSAGNNGCHKLDSCILRPLNAELYSRQFANATITKMLNERIILVSAKDDILYDGETAKSKDPDWWTTNGEYADRPKTFHQWVTTIDISHLKYPDNHSMDGTSFAAPLLLGHIARLFDLHGYRSENSDAEKGITITEMTSVIKKLTETDAMKNRQPGLLDIAALNQKMKNLHLDFSGTKWEMVYLRGMVGCSYCYSRQVNANLFDTECSCVIEFFENGRFRQTGITNNGENSVDEGTYSYKGLLDEFNYNYPQYEGIFERRPLFGNVGEYKVIGNLYLQYNQYRNKIIKVLDRPIPTPSGKSALLEVDDHRMIGCTMWFGGGTVR